MKSFTWSFVLILMISLLTWACGESHSHEHSTTEQTEEQHEAPVNSSSSGEALDVSGPEYTSAYICPMTCKGSGSDQPGQCPVCGMDYVARTEKAKTEDHNH